MGSNLLGHYYTVTSLETDDLYLYSGSVDTSIIRWNISSGFINKEYIGHEAIVRTIKTRENFLYSGASNSKVFVWEKEKENTFTTLYCKC
jgi:WD40 repeat protein